MKIVELRLSKLISAKTKTVSMVAATQAASPSILQKLNHHFPFPSFQKLEERVGVIGQHLTSPAKAPQVLRARARSRLPITTLVLDVSKGCPAGGIDLRLEMWKGGEGGPSVGEIDIGRWVLEPYSTIDINEHG